MSIWLIMAHRLPIWAVGVYGSEWSETPHLDDLASRSVVFHQHFADTPRKLTQKSMSLCYPWSQIASPLDLSTVRWVEPPTTDWPTPDTDSDQWLQCAQRAMTTFDDWLGSWIEHSYSIDDWVFLTSGQGVPLPSAEWWGRSTPNSIHESLVHVPLIIHMPRDEEAGRCVLELTQTVDLARALSELIGVPAAKQEGQGWSLLPLLRGDRACRPYAIFASEDQRTWAMQTKSEKVVLNTGAAEGERLQYFIKPDDRWDVNDMRHVRFDRAEQLAQALERVIDLTRHLTFFEPPRIPDMEDDHGHS